jgi:hypothetical protein
MTPSESESVLAYYWRLFARAGRDARTHIARNGIVAGLLIAIVAGFVQSQLDDAANFGNVAIAAIAAAILYSLAFFVWHLFRAPVAMSNDERASNRRELHTAIAPKQDELAARDLQIAQLQAKVTQYETSLAHQAPKLALVEQLRKLDGIGGLGILAALGKSDEDQIDRLKADIRDARAWESETRQTIRNLVPEYERDFSNGPMLPFVDLPIGVAIKLSDTRKVLAWKSAKGAALSEIIKRL